MNATATVRSTSPQSWMSAPSSSSASRAAHRATKGLTETLTRVAAAHSALCGVDQAARSSAADQKLLQSAATKLDVALVALSSGADLTDSLGLMLAQQAELSTARRAMAKTLIQNQLDKAQGQNMRKLTALKKQAQEANSSSLWDSFCKVFQAIGAGIGAVASAVTGNPMLMVGSALAIGSLIGAQAPGDLGIGLSLGLGVAGAGFSIWGGFSNAKMYTLIADKSVQALVDTSLKTCAAAASVKASVGRIPAGAHRYLSQVAAANAKSAEASAETHRAKAADEREVMRGLYATEQRAVELVMGAMAINDRADRVAMSFNAAR